VLGAGDVNWSPGLETSMDTAEPFRGRSGIRAEIRKTIVNACSVTFARHSTSAENIRGIPDHCAPCCGPVGRTATSSSVMTKGVRIGGGVCLDVTERKHAEETLHLAIEAAPAAMVMVDANGAIVMVNALTEQILGYDRQELVGRSVEMLVPFRFLGRHAGDRDAFFADPQQRPMGVGRELYAARKDGSEVPVEIGLSPIHTATGTFVLAAVTDISERKAIEQQRAEPDARTGGTHRWSTRVV
jgi:PAS domain S-box-containing protein